MLSVTVMMSLKVHEALRGRYYFNFYAFRHSLGETMSQQVKYVPKCLTAEARS